MLTKINLILIPFLYAHLVISSPVPEGQENPELGPYFEGDIILTPNQLGGKPNVNSRWPSRTLVYSIGPGFNEKEKKFIQDAIKEIQSKTCIRFRQGSTGDHVVYTKSFSGCSSSIGRVGGRQVINLASGCFNVGPGTVVHETFHALGFYHEQTRNDRDNYVVIHADRIEPSRLGNFRKETSSLTFGVPYDYGSIMHYPKVAFPKQPGMVTVETKSKGANIGQRRAMSPLDIMKLNRMYGC
ncbi:unnamed protein product [Allacma fusca]|uniref:Peptidase M12A domain-containing protein n=1 Tax=Allacma fusca TaxID=39272 RepID=A0A8J2JZG4_9HEXA|nr:unnamed protein product [Allacma fusca]